MNSLEGTARRSIQTRRSDTWFYGGMGIVAILVVWAGFGRSFYGLAAGTASLTPVVQLHSLVFGAWLLLFVIQTMLIAAKNIKAHRQLGMAASVVALSMLVLGYVTAIEGARRGFDLTGKGDPLGYSVFPLGDLVSFAALTAAGFLWRRRADAHKRLMLLATVGALLNAPLAHWIAHTPALNARGSAVIVPMMLILLFASAAYDKFSRGRIHPVSLYGAIILFVWGNLRAALIGPSKIWHDFAAWLTR